MDRSRPSNLEVRNLSAPPEMEKKNGPRFGRQAQRHPALLLLLILLAFALACRKNGPEKAATPARALSPAERIEKLTQVEKKYNNPSAAEDRPVTPEEKVTVTGQIKTADGLPLPGDCRVFTFLRHANSSFSSVTDLDPQGHFSATVEPGLLSVLVTGAGYAPAFTGPYEVRPKGQIKNLVMVLSRGFKGRIRLTDPQGRPVGGGRIEGAYAMPNGASIDNFKLAIGPGGLATLDRCSTCPLSLAVSAKGYQEDERNPVQLTPERELVWKLKPAQVVHGTVRAGKNNQPLIGARVYVLQRNTERPGHSYTRGYDTSNPPLLAETDGAGGFRLDTFQDDSSYVLLVTAPGYGRKIVARVSTRSGEVNVVLGPEIRVRGRVIGPLDGLMKNFKGELEINCENPIRVDDFMNNDRHEVPLKVQGGVGYFEIPELYPGKLKLHVGGREFTRVLDKSIEDLVVDLRPGAKPAEPEREIVIRFELPTGAPAPRGKLAISYYRTPPVDKNSPDWAWKEFELQQGEIRFTLPVPSHFNTSNKDKLVGCWFGNTPGWDVTEGKGPFEVTVPAKPAGAIYGQVMKTDGRSLSASALYSLSLAVEEPAPATERFAVDSSLRLGDLGKFMAGPLPFGGTYRIMACASESGTYLMSDPVRIDAQTPLQEVELKVPRGVKVCGRVLTSEGRPIAGVEVRLGISISPNNGYSSGSVSTNEEGWFTYARVNPDVKGKYSLSIDSQRDYVPVVMKEMNPGRSPFTIKLERGAVICGVVEDEQTGKPLRDATIFASQNYPNRQGVSCQAESRSDAQGRFRFSNLPHDKVSLGAYLERYQLPQSVYATGDAGTTVTLRMSQRR